MSLFFDALQYYILASGVASAIILVWGWLWQRSMGRPGHRQPVYGPFRPNLRKIV